MVDLTPEPGPLTVSKAPTPGISPQQVAAPFNELADNLTKIGEAAGTVADQAAQRAGAQAVTRDDQGQLVVAPAPIIGPASGVYARAAYSSYLAKATPDIEDGILQLRLAHPNDIKAFQAAAAGFKTSMLSKIDDPLLRGPIEKIIDTNTGQNFRSAILENDRVHLQNTATALQSRLSEINEQGASLARQNGVETPEYAQIVAERDGIYKELQGDARFNYPPERVHAEMSANRDADVVQAVVGHITRDYQTRRNMGQAQAALQDAFWGPGSENLALTPQKRDAGVAEGLKSLQRVTTEDAAETTQNREAVKSYAKNLQEAPGTFDLITHNTMVAKAQSIGDYKSIADLDAARIMQPVWQSISGLTDGQKVAVQSQLSRGLVPVVPQQMSGLSGAPKQKAAYDFFIDKGWSPAQSAGIVGGLRGETAGLDPTQIHDGGMGIGIAGWNGQRRAALNEFAAANNASPTDLKTQLEFVNFELNGSERTAGDKLRAAQTPEQAGQATLSYFRPANYDAPGAHPERALYARSAFNAFSGGTDGSPGALRPGQPIGSVSNPYVQSLFWNTVSEQRKSLAGNVERMAENIIDTAVNKRQAVTPDELNIFALGTVATGRTDLVPKVEQALQTYDSYQGVATGAASPSVAALRSQIETVAASGTNPIARHMLNSLDQMIGAGTEAMQKDPIGQAAVRGWVAPINPLPTNNAQAAAVELAQRQQKIEVMRARDATIGPLTAIGSQEAQGVKVALTQGPADQAGGLIEAMAQTLAPDNFKATMASPEIKDALIKMTNSSDPARMTLGMSTLDRIWRASPQDFKAVYGDGTLTRLQAWQGLKDSFTAQEVAERMGRADDPALSLARDKLKEQAVTELKAYTPSEIAYQMGSGLPILNTLTANVTGATPAVPSDSLQAQQLAGQFDGIYKALRIYGVEADQAKTLAIARLKSEWGPTALAHNQLMQYPPDKYYQPIDGSLNWMRGDFTTYLNQKLGEQVTDYTPGFPDVGMVRVNWSVKGLISDPQTQAEIAAGKPPSYRVAVQDNRGMINILPDRIGWDRTAHVQKAEREFTVLDEAAKARQALMLGISTSPGIGGP